MRTRLLTLVYNFIYMNEGSPRQAPKLESRNTQENPTSSPVIVENSEQPTTVQPEAEEPRIEPIEVTLSTTSATDLRQYFDQLRQKENFEPGEKAKGYSHLRKAVDDRRRELSSGTKPGEARVRLSTPETSQSDQLVKAATSSEMRELDVLDKDIQDEIRENRKVEESRARERNLMREALSARDAAAMFAHEILKRERSGMDPLINPQAFTQLRSGVTALYQFAETRGRADMEQLGNAFTWINSGLNGIERTRTKGPIHESEESLGKLGFSMRNLYDAIGKMRRNFTEGDEVASLSGRRLMETSERVDGFTSKLRSIIRNKQ